jgi:hypothetical protein
MMVRGERLLMQQEAAMIDTFRSRVEGLYADVEAWLANDMRFRFGRAPLAMIESIGNYSIDRLNVYAAKQRLLEFRPVGAAVLLGEGRVDIWGTIDFAMLLYFESSPVSTSTITNADRTSTHKSTTHLFMGIDRPGWYWIDARHDDARLFNNRTLSDILVEISDFERERT